MGEKADFQTCFNLLVCYYALGDEEMMCETFTQLLSSTPYLCLAFAFKGRVGDGLPNGGGPRPKRAERGRVARPPPKKKCAQRHACLANLLP